MEQTILIIGIVFFIIAAILFIRAKNRNVLLDQAEEKKKKIEQDIEGLTEKLGNLNRKSKEAEDSIRSSQSEIKYINQTINEKQQEVKRIQKDIEEQKKRANNFYNQEKMIVEKQLENFKNLSSKAAENYFDNLQEAYRHADAAHAEKLARLKAEQETAAASLVQLKETRRAAYEAVLKQKEIKANKDNYRLTPSPTDLQDIHSLERIKKSLHKPRILSMLIWQTYWQPIAKKQFPIILQAKTKTGIYKITNIQTDESYIGQSLDIYKRWSEHCKAGLGIDTPVGNKLYKAIQSYGLENFTFELLCQCPKEQLDEKERYFISLYQADTFGYNSTIGNK